MNASETNRQLHTLLAAIASELSTLHELLQAEQVALTSGSFELLPELAQRKDAASMAIERYEQQRRDLLASMNLSHTSDGMQQFSRRLAPNQLRELANTWQSVSLLGKNCQQQNQLNGIMLAHHQRRTLAALRLLRGQNTHHEIYSARGNKEGEFSQQTLARI